MKPVVNLKVVHKNRSIGALFKEAMRSFQAAKSVDAIRALAIQQPFKNQMIRHKTEQLRLRIEQGKKKAKRYKAGLHLSRRFFTFDGVAIKIPALHFELAFVIDPAQYIKRIWLQEKVLFLELKPKSKHGRVKYIPVTDELRKKYESLPPVVAY